MDLLSVVPSRVVHGDCSCDPVVAAVDLIRKENSHIFSMVEVHLVVDQGVVH